MRAYLQSEGQINQAKDSDYVIIAETFLDIRELSPNYNYKDLVNVDIDEKEVYIASIWNLNAVIDKVKDTASEDDIITVISSEHKGTQSFDNMLTGRVIQENLDDSEDRSIEPNQILELLRSIKETWEEYYLIGESSLDKYLPEEIEEDICTKTSEVPKA